jgi:hypothetical protein
MYTAWTQRLSSPILFSIESLHCLSTGASFVRLPPDRRYPMSDLHHHQAASRSRNRTELFDVADPFCSRNCSDSRRFQAFFPTYNLLVSEEPTHSGLTEQASLVDLSIQQSELLCSFSCETLSSSSPSAIHRSEETAQSEQACPIRCCLPPITNWLMHR